MTFPKQGSGGGKPKLMTLAEIAASLRAPPPQEPPNDSQKQLPSGGNYGTSGRGGQDATAPGRDNLLEMMLAVEDDDTDRGLGRFLGAYFAEVEKALNDPTTPPARRQLTAEQTVAGLSFGLVVSLSGASSEITDRAGKYSLFALALNQAADSYHSDSPAMQQPLRRRSVDAYTTMIRALNYPNEREGRAIYANVIAQGGDPEGRIESLLSKHLMVQRGETPQQEAYLETMRAKLRNFRGGGGGGRQQVNLPARQ